MAESRNGEEARERRISRPILRNARTGLPLRSGGDVLTPLKDRLPTKRERLTPTQRLRRRPVHIDHELTFGNHGERAPGGDGMAGRTGNDRFRLVCWNIEDGLDVDGTIAGLSDHPNLRNADAVCLQEMDPEGVDRIGATLGLNSIYLESSRDERTGRGFGNAILSPWPLDGCVAVPLPHVAKAYGRPRAAIGATVAVTRPEAKAWPVTVWSIHTEIPSLSLTRRVAQFTAVAARAIAPNPDRLLLAGDFNTTTAQSVEALDELYQLFDLDRLSAPAGPSLRRAGRLFRLDHIYGRGVDVAAVGVEREVIASDHWPLWIELRPPTEDTDDRQ